MYIYIYIWYMYIYHRLQNIRICLSVHIWHHHQCSLRRNDNIKMNIKILRCEDVD
jgi:hypothetical protein